MSIIEGWTGKLERYVRERCGILSIKVGNIKGCQAYFDAKDLCINGRKCSERGHLHSYVKLGEMLHLNAVKLRKPKYEMGQNVWYHAYLVWTGTKPIEADASDDDVSEYESIAPDKPEVYGEFGEVVKIVNKNTAVIKSLICGNKKPSLVVVERCRLYIDGLPCSSSGNIAKNIKLGDTIHFEAFQLNAKHPSGVKYHANLAWTVARPDVDLKKPVHTLNLPGEPLFPPVTTASLSVAGPSSGRGAVRMTKDRATETKEADFAEAQAGPSVQQQALGLLGLVVALPNASTAVIKGEVDGSPVLVALERCRFFINNRICPKDIRTVVVLGSAIRFEAFSVGEALPCGVQFRVSLAWLGRRPHLTLERPSHSLELPSELNVNLLAALNADLLK